MKKITKQTAVIISVAMFFGGLANPASSMQAAKKTVLKSKSMVLSVNQSKSVILKNKVAGAAYTFKSKNSKIAVVTKKGKVTGKKQGTTTITVNQKKNKRIKLVGKVKVKVRKVENQAKVSPAVSSTATPAVAATSTPVGTNTPNATKAPERTHITGDKEQKELTQNVFKANQPEAIFKNHTSVSYSYHHADGTYRNHYSTVESDYYEESGFAEYRTNDRITYQIDGIGKENPTVMYTVDVSKNYSPIWDWYVVDNEKEFYDEEHDRITDCYIEDGRVYVFSCFDEEASEYYVKEIFGRKYTGQKVLSKTVADAKTYELYWVGAYIEGDEDIKNASYYEISYDESEPEQSLYMRVFFERPAEKYMTVTYVGIHSDGTKITKSVTVPVNSEVVYSASDIPDMTIYDDEECTIPVTEHWDRNSDVIGYVASKKDASKQVGNFIDALAAQKNEKYSGNLESSNAFNFMSEKSRVKALESAEDLPSKFDLRDRGVVTPVKNQGHHNTCWAYGALGASEISILSSLGTTYEKAKLDLSERHLAYFTYRHIPEDKNNPQAGEGVYWPEGEHDTSVLFLEGGTTYMPLHMFASGMGPVMESDVPYEGKNKLIREDWNGNPLEYSAGDDWTVSEKMRFKREYNLTEGNILPQPVKYVTDKYGNTKYEYNEAATAAIKSELYQGRGVSASYANNWDKPYMDVYSDNPSQYAYEPGWPNHAILLVGWDDNYAKENFRTTFKGQTHEPEGDGAWIARNSWGSGEQEFPNKGSGVFGIVNEEGIHTGYFYISYYDQSLNSDVGAFTFEFEKADRDAPEIINQHDFMLMRDFKWQLVDFKIRTSNIFTADKDQNIESVGVYTVHPQTRVNVKLYEMIDGTTEPDEGVLVAEKSQTFDYGGFHRVDFDNSPLIAGGEKFSAVVTATVDTDEGTKYLYITNYGKNEKYFHTYGEQEGLLYYHRGIVNPGESYVYFEDDGKWYDYADMVKKYKDDYGNMYDYDNFNIKVYSRAADSSTDDSN